MSAEDDLIARHFAPLAGPGGLGLKDDAALLAPPPGQELVLTKDLVIGGVHFFADDPPGAIARKALRVNLSDLAAKGAEPLGFLLGLGLPDALRGAAREDGLAAFAAALGEDARAYACPLLGGDTVASRERVMISVTALGAVPAGRMAPRTGARAGDRLFVSGTIGDAALGLRARLEPGARWLGALTAEERTHLADRYLVPRPRNALAAALRAHAHAAMDVSDGLVGDLSKLLRVSGMGAAVDLDAAPLSAAARAALMADPTLAELAFTGGDDYEIVCAVPPQEAAAFAAAAAEAGVPVACIGEATADPGSIVFTRGGQPVRFAREAYSHV